jgi:CTD kinase subunit alpha
MESGQTITDEQVKYYMKSILEGLQYIHSCDILHRDIKGANVLVSNNGEVKLADFGLARNVAPNVECYTNRVVTLWYRSPELLLGVTKYTTKVDMWALG